MDIILKLEELFDHMTAKSFSLIMMDNIVKLGGSDLQDCFVFPMDLFKKATKCLIIAKQEVDVRIFHYYMPVFKLVFSKAADLDAAMQHIYEHEHFKNTADKIPALRDQYPAGNFDKESTELINKIFNNTDERQLEKQIREFAFYITIAPKPIINLLMMNAAYMNSQTALEIAVKVLRLLPVFFTLRVPHVYFPQKNELIIIANFRHLICTAFRGSCKLKDISYMATELTCTQLSAKDKSEEESSAFDANELLSDLIVDLVERLNDSNINVMLEMLHTILPLTDEHKLWRINWKKTDPTNPFESGTVDPQKLHNALYDLFKRNMPFKPIKSIVQACNELYSRLKKDEFPMTEYEDDIFNDFIREQEEKERAQWLDKERLERETVERQNKEREEKERLKFEEAEQIRKAKIEKEREREEKDRNEREEKDRAERKNKEKELIEREKKKEKKSTERANKQRDGKSQRKYKSQDKESTNLTSFTVENQVKNVEEETAKEKNPVVKNIEVENIKEDAILDGADEKMKNKTEAEFDPNMEKAKDEVIGEQKIDNAAIVEQEKENAGKFADLPLASQIVEIHEEDSLESSDTPSLKSNLDPNAPRFNPPPFQLSASNQQVIPEVRTFGNVSRSVRPIGNRPPHQFDVCHQNQQNHVPSGDHPPRYAQGHNNLPPRYPSRPHSHNCQLRLQPRPLVGMNLSPNQPNIVGDDNNSNNRWRNRNYQSETAGGFAGSGRNFRVNRQRQFIAPSQGSPFANPDARYQYQRPHSQASGQMDGN